MATLGAAPAANSASGEMRQIADHAGKLGIEICDIAGNVEEDSNRVKHQAERFKELHTLAGETSVGNERIAAAATHAHTVAERANAEVLASRATVDESLRGIH